MVVPQNGWFIIMEHPIKRLMIWEYHDFVGNLHLIFIWFGEDSSFVGEQIRFELRYLQPHKIVISMVNWWWLFNMIFITRNTWHDIPVNGKYL